MIRPYGLELWKREEQVVAPPASWPANCRGSNKPTNLLYYTVRGTRRGSDSAIQPYLVSAISILPCSGRLLERGCRVLCGSRVPGCTVGSWMIVVQTSRLTQHTISVHQIPPDGAPAIRAQGVGAMEPRLLPQQPPPRNSLARHAARWRRTLSTAREPPLSAAMSPAILPSQGQQYRPHATASASEASTRLVTCRRGTPNLCQTGDDEVCCICLDAWASRDDHCDLATTADSAAAWQFGRAGVLVCCCDCPGGVGRFASGLVSRARWKQNHRTSGREPQKLQTAPQHPPRVKCKCPSSHPTRIGLPSHDSHWLVCWSSGLLACCCRAINLDCRCRVASRVCECSVVVESRRL